MLWQKQLIHRKSVYVDVFNGIEPFFTMRQFLNEVFCSIPFGISPTKNTSLAEHAIDIAHKMQENNEKPEMALKFLNLALCNYKDLGMSYGIRAVCFFAMKQYRLCLADIELAKKNKFPLKDLPNLDQLKSEALQLMEDADGDDVELIEEPKLSFPSDEKIPCFAQGLEVRKSKKFGMHIVTNRNLEIGQTVIIEDAFCIAASNAQNYLQCANCFERKANLIPCKNCAAIMFCSQKCYDIGHDKFHAFECGKGGVHSNWEASRRVVLQTVIHAIKLFPNIKNLMSAVDKFHNRKPNSEINYADPSIRTYMQFFALGLSNEHTPDMQDIQFLEYSKIIHAEITSDAAYKSTFRTLEASRFLAHLILHHFYIIDANAFGAISYLHGICTTELGSDAVNLSGFDYAGGVYLNSSRLNHSCQPNIARIFMKNKLVCKVIRPIKRGEQLFVTYLNPLNLLKSVEYRNGKLTKIYYFQCKCKSCESDIPPFKTCVKANMDVTICRLLGMFNSSPGRDLLNHSMIVTRNEMLKFEESAVKYLQSNDHLHPTEETLLIQFLLTQIWNNLGR